MKQVTAELVYHNYARLGEGSLWDERAQLLYWVDIRRRQVYAYNPKTCANSGYDVKEQVGTLVFRESGGLMLAQKDGFAFLDLRTGAVKKITDPESHLPNNRFNDGKCDPQGRFWAGTMAEPPETGAGALYCLDRDFTVSKKIENVTLSNGLVWTKAQDIFYFVDSLTYCIAAYDYDPSSGAISNKRKIKDFPPEEGLPDGMAIDTEDHLWVSLFGGGRVVRVDPETGETVFEVLVPHAPDVTSCAFGGEGWDDLYITTASPNMTDADWETKPNSGGLFRAKVPFQGVPSARFQG